MIHRVFDNVVAFLDWLITPLRSNILGFLALAAMSWWVGEPAFSHLRHGGQWTDSVSTGLVHDRNVFLHIWFIVPVSIGFLCMGFGFLYGFDDAPALWRRWLLRFDRRTDNR